MSKLTSKIHKYFFVRKRHAKKNISGTLLSIAIREKKTEKEAIELAQEILVLKDKKIKYAKRVYNNEADFIGRGKFVILVNKEE